MTEAAHEHLVELRRSVGLPGDLVDAQREQLVARVAERPAGALVDRDVAHLVVGDEDERRPGVDRLAEERGLDQDFCGSHGAPILGSSREFA